MQIPIISGIYVDNNANYRTAYPVNMVPVPIDTGAASGYLRVAEGIVAWGNGPGQDRGGVNWRDVCYRVMGTKLIRILVDGRYQILGDVGAGGQCSFAISFDRLAIASGGRLYYLLLDDSLVQVTDPDLGDVVDITWSDGYFVFTDGEFIGVTELNDPMTINPLKYGSSEVDPDPIVALTKLRNEVYAINRYTIEVFQNVGGDFFPYQRIPSAVIQRGAIGTRACKVFMEALAFIGGGRNESPSVWLGSNGATTKLSTREIEGVLSEYSDEDLSRVILEVRLAGAHQFLYIHLPDKTLVFDGAASQAINSPIWFILSSSLNPPSVYLGRNFVWCYNKWICGNVSSTQFGYLSNETAEHFGAPISWEFSTKLIYNDSRRAIIHQLELVGVPGSMRVISDPLIWTSYSLDGVVWSEEIPKNIGAAGQRSRGLTWFQQGYFLSTRIQKFRGTSNAYLSVNRLEITAEGLNV